MNRKKRVNIKPIDIDTLEPKYKTPSLTKEEKAHNSRVSQKLHRIKMEQLGYKRIRIWVPDELRKEVRAKAEEIVKAWEIENDVKR